MTETDATNRPLEMVPRFIPYMEKYRVYQIFKDMLKDLLINLPKDHLKHMKIFLHRYSQSCKDADRIILLVSPELEHIDITAILKQLIKDLGLFVITRRVVMDRYEKHENYMPGCVSPVVLSEITKTLTMKDQILQAGWLMFDHPCTVREARCLQQDGVLPTVTLALMPTPPQAPPSDNLLTSARSFFQQDFEGLKFAYKATLKEVYIDSEDEIEKISTKCFNAIRACAAGAQGPYQGHHVVGAPGVYRVLVIGPRGSGRRSQALALAKHFRLVYLHFDDLLSEAKAKTDEFGQKLRQHEPSVQVKAVIVKRRILLKDCIDNGWVLVGFPMSGKEFELLDNTPTPPNRIIILNVDASTCKSRRLSRGVDWCSGDEAPLGSGSRVMRHPRDDEAQLETELDNYFSEALAELRAAAGITAVEFDASQSFDGVQVKLQAAVMAAPSFDIECGAQLCHVRAD
ncbi:adenylate kinase 8 isoform X1 [Bombyx mori]|uniref:Adenylate kinase 8 n=2 Tax=Bombyx mori TaxID=7091 RepID=A0A8R2AM36_BOMMO|nr:adenylate kinase 8 isoform X1 [Bombyx mori]